MIGLPSESPYIEDFVSLLYLDEYVYWKQHQIPNTQLQYYCIVQAQKK